MIIKVISGAQTGADIAGLVTAESVGLLTGGFVPPKCLTDDGPNPQLINDYGLTEIDDTGSTRKNYAIRTSLNVKNSDMTIIFCDKLTPGTKLTIKECERLKKRYIIVHTNDVQSPDRVAVQLISAGVSVLNVAGNKERISPGIRKFTETYLSKMLKRYTYSISRRDAYDVLTKHPNLRFYENIIETDPWILCDYIVNVLGEPCPKWHNHLARAIVPLSRYVQKVYRDRIPDLEDKIFSSSAASLYVNAILPTANVDDSFIDKVSTNETSCIVYRHHFCNDAQMIEELETKMMQSGTSVLEYISTFGFSKTLHEYAFIKHSIDYLMILFKLKQFHLISSMTNKMDREMKRQLKSRIESIIHGQ